MTMYEKGLITILVISILLVVLAIPLVLRKVPRNVIYGYRTRVTMSSDALWFDINANFGRNLIVAALSSAVAIIGLYLFHSPYLDAFIPVSVLTIAVPLLVAVLATKLYIRTIKRAGTH